MLSRRLWLAAATSPLWPCPASPTRALAWSDLPASAHGLASDLQLSAPNWGAYLAARQSALAARIPAGSAEHLIYYILQSVRFTSLPPLSPLQLARLGVHPPGPAARARIDAFAATAGRPLDLRHGLLVDLYRQLPSEWTLAACYRHTMEFLHTRLAEARTQEQVDALYQDRGLSSDSAPANTLTLSAAWPLLNPAPRAALLIGPGLDLTRREDFSGQEALAQPQLDRLLSLLGPNGRVDCIDVRPEVLAFLHQTGRCGFASDITAQVPALAAYDLAVATNILIYHDDRALFTSLAAISASLKPGGYLLHNDMRFAAKVFGRALQLPVVHFSPVSLGTRQGIEQMDRVVLHRKSIP